MERDLTDFLSGVGESNGNKAMLARSSSRWVLGRAPRVCVIGAGVAGLRCSEILLDAGVDVTLLEARDRVGGRVRPPSQAQADRGS